MMPNQEFEQKLHAGYGINAIKELKMPKKQPDSPYSALYYSDFRKKVIRVLEEAEWAYSDFCLRGFCPVCKKFKQFGHSYEGHTKNCSLKAVLDELKGEQDAG